MAVSNLPFVTKGEKNKRFSFYLFDSDTGEKIIYETATQIVIVFYVAGIANYVFKKVVPPQDNSEQLYPGVDNNECYAYIPDTSNFPVGYLSATVEITYPKSGYPGNSVVMFDPVIIALVRSGISQ